MLERENKRKREKERERERDWTKVLAHGRENARALLKSLAICFWGKFAGKLGLNKMDLKLLAVLIAFGPRLITRLQ
jgi:hypothetical protein